MSSELELVCPAGRLVSSDPANPKVVCGPMERDQARQDRILEGAPVGVVISGRDDPSTLFGFCCGTGAPQTSPDGPLTAHYTCCPIFAADREWDELQRRLFGSAERPNLEFEREEVSYEEEDMFDIRELIS